METKKEGTTVGHTCPPGHCCDCNGCTGVWMHERMPMGMRRYWRRHFLILVLGVIAAFFVGMKLGEIKGYLLGGYGMYPSYHRSWMMEDRRGNAYYGYPSTLVAPGQPAIPPATQPTQQ